MDAITPHRQLPLIDLAAQRRRLGRRIDDAVLGVIDRGAYILGPEVEVLERELSAFCGAEHTLSCASGTDALALALMARGVARDDAILCPSFTFAATAEVIAWLGAIPVFVDVRNDTFNLDIASLEAGLAAAKKDGLRVVGIIPVDLFGQPVDYDPILDFADAHALWVLADAAQSFGAQYKSGKVGRFGFATATSFFPAKPLGCYGDGGAVFTDDAELAAVMRSLRVHGQGADKYDNVRIGMNGRLDTVQAAVLIEKLKIFPDEILARDKVAQRYSRSLGNIAITPRVLEGCTSVWAQYTVRLPDRDRDAIAARLRERGIATAIYYPKPLHRQTAYRQFPTAGELQTSDTICHEVLSLPMHPYLDPESQDRIIDELSAAAQKG